MAYMCTPIIVSTHTLTLVLFTAPSTHAVTSVDAQNPTTRTTNAPSVPVSLTDAQPAESDHVTHDAGTRSCSMCPSEKRTSIVSVSEAV